MPHLGQTWRVKSTNFSTLRKVLQRDFVTFMANLKDQINNFLSTPKTVVQRNGMPHLWQAWRVKSTNFSVHRIILQRNVVTLRASLKGRINKCLGIQDNCYATFRTSIKGQINNFRDTQESPAEKFYLTFRASLKSQINDLFLHTGKLYVQGHSTRRYNKYTEENLGTYCWF